MLKVFCHRLKEERERQGISVQKISDLLAISPRTYYSYETTSKNSREPDLAMLVKLSKILDVTTDYLLGLSDEV